MTDAPENAQPEGSAFSVDSSSSSASELAVSPARHRKALIVLACVALGAIVLDRLAKQWAIDVMLPRLQNGEGPIQVIGTWVQFTYTENTGAAFSMGTGYTWIFSVIAIIVAIVILRTARKLGSVGWAIALGGLLGGLLGNLLDRLTREPGIGRGYVVDFIQFPNFPVFNVADIFITCSAALMVLLTLLGLDYRGSRIGAK
ncbi:MAG: signal peptidase II [Actinomycetes bacterium]